MKIIHQNGYNRDELLTFRTTIYKNLLESAHHILLAMRKIGVDCVNPQNRVRVPRGRRSCSASADDRSRRMRTA